MKTRRLTRLSLLTAAALIIFVVEQQFPNIIPINGVKLGLANIITVYAIYRYTPKETAMIIFVRILLGSLFSGNMMSFAFSFSGAFMCFFAMLFVKKIIPSDKMALSSVVGAIAHNTGQIIAAVFVSGSFSVLIYFPILLFSGCIAGFFTGTVAGFVAKRLDKIDK